jgi:hypothetical protein
MIFLKIFLVLYSILATVESNAQTSECHSGPEYGPLRNSMTKYQTIYIERMSLVSMKNGKTIKMLYISNYQGEKLCNLITLKHKNYQVDFLYLLW